MNLANQLNPKKYSLKMMKEKFKKESGKGRYKARKKAKATLDAEYVAASEFKKPP